MNRAEGPSKDRQASQRQPTVDDVLLNRDDVTGDRPSETCHRSSPLGYGEPTDQAGVGDSQSKPGLSERTGPFYGQDGLLSALGLTEHALAVAVVEHRILGLTTGDGGTVYPAWQFYADGSTIPHLPEVLNILADGIDDPWTWAIWLSAVDDDLDGLTSAQWLAAGHDPEPVLLEASRDAARWRT